MKRSIYLVSLVLVGTGCGGSGGGVATPFPAKYVGTWSGSYTGSSNGDSGTATLIVDGTGSVGGNVNDNNIGQTGTVSGRMQNSGSFSVTITYPTAGSGTLSGAAVYTASNPPTLTDATATETGNQGQGSQTVSFSLTKQ